ncbi:MAG TPA: TauD/TfdA family dioxygenase [Burkholderiales bacterium]|nr:TauD/TfdA family dioxygenase [Burkholderiales bacterium]
MNDTRLDVGQETALPMPVAKIRGKAAWYGRELASRQDWIVRLSHQNLHELAAAVRAFKASDVPLAEISPQHFPLPGMKPELDAILHELLEGRGFVLMRGLPVADMGREEQAIAYMGLGSYFGIPRSQNAKGHLLGHVKDLGLDVRNPNVRYYQTTRGLEYHTDSVDIVGLLCLKTAKAGGESFIASSTTIYNEILARRPDLLPALFEAFPTDRRGEVPQGMLPWFDIPVFHWHQNRLSAIYARQYIRSAQDNFPQARRLTQRQIEALDLLDDLTNDPDIHLSMAFLPGDMQFLHNHQIFHSRNDFENWPEPARQRHLLRLWLCARGGRPLPDTYAQRYGSVTPGNRGGIVVPGTVLKVPLEAE